ncbi:MAG TPA: hypothetical protein VIH42_01235 [Thermoguttaceae bacterium]
MQCPQCIELIDNLLIAEPTDAEHVEMVRHLLECPDCARQYALAQQALAAITPSIQLRASADFKERIMHAISSATAQQSKPIVRVLKAQTLYIAVTFAVAIALMIVLIPLFIFGPNVLRPKGISALNLLSEASAAEAKLFSGTELIHMINEIIVTPVADPELAQGRWFPLVSLEANGKPRFNQLALSAEANKGYTVEDQSWYDPPSGRFTRILTVDNKPIFANSFDGKNIYSLEIPTTGKAKVVQNPIVKDFQPPRSPAEFLGIAAGLKSGLDVKDQGTARIEDAGKVKLNDGTEARLLKFFGLPQGGPKESEDNYFLYTIREDNNTIEKIEWLLKGQSLMIVRRVKTETGQESKSGWDLAGIAEKAGSTTAQAGPLIRLDMIIMDVAVEDMVKKADYPTYIFDKDPSWADDRKITDILDIGSPPHRMFLITYKAKDHRHVVLIQSPTYNKMLGPKVKEKGKVIYTSPSGIKVWDIQGKSAWLAQILLQSARSTIQEPPVAEPTGYLLETPDGTFPALAVNGKITEEELHTLIDSLVPAK